MGRVIAEGGSPQINKATWRIGMRLNNMVLCRTVLAICLAAGIAQALMAQDPAPAAPLPATADGMIDAMDDPKAWNVYKDDRGVKIDLSVLEAKNGKAVEVSYTMGPGEWFGIFKTVDQDFSAFKGIRFVYRGLGNGNSIECKLEDGDGSIYGKVLGTKSNVGSWTVVEIPFTDLSYWWGGDNKLTWEQVHNVHFAVSRKTNEDKGGTGKVSIDQVELYK